MKRLKSFLLIAWVGISPFRAAAGEAVDESYPSDRVDEIVIETRAGAISLTAAEGRQISVHADASGSECRVARKLGGGTLTLSARGQASKMFALDKVCSAGYSVSAPAGVRIRAYSVSGTVNVGAFSGPVEVKTGAGDIALGAPTGRLTLRSSRGAISGSAPGELVGATTQTGAISLTRLTGLVKAHSGSGAVSLSWESLPGRGEIEVMTVSGEQTVSLPADARAAVSMKTESGRKSSDFRNDESSDLRLRLRSTSGSISVESARRDQ